MPPTPPKDLQDIIDKWWDDLEAEGLLAVVPLLRYSTPSDVGRKALTDDPEEEA